MYIHVKIVSNKRVLIDDYLEKIYNAPIDSKLREMHITPEVSAHRES